MSTETPSGENGARRWVSYDAQISFVCDGDEDEERALLRQATRAAVGALKGHHPSVGAQGPRRSEPLGDGSPAHQEANDG